MDYSVFPGVVLNLAKQLKTSYLATQISSLCKTENCIVTKQTVYLLLRSSSGHAGSDRPKQVRNLALELN